MFVRGKPRKEIIMKVQDLIEEIRKNVEKVANVKAIFGELTKVDNISIIPVASIHFKGGGGGGTGEMGEDKKKDKAEKIDVEKQPSRKGEMSKGKGKGGGGGVQITADPVGYIEIKDDYTNFVHIIDKNRIAQKAVKLVGIIFVCMTVKSIFKRKRRK